MSQVNIHGYPGVASNVTYLDECTPDLCSLTYAVVKYLPNSLANAAFAAIFASFLVAQMVMWFFYRTHSYTFAMSCGLILEILGYMARVAMRNQMFVEGPFLIQIICLTIAPVFFTAALYLTLSRIIMHYGPHNSRLSPKAYTITFISSDVIALILQSVGGALTETAASLADAETGTNIMVGGLSFQVASLTTFSLLAAEFFWNVKNDRRQVRATNWAQGKVERPAEVKGYKTFIWALAAATVLVLLRSSYRVAELAHGFRSHLANDQVAFMTLEGGVMLAATMILTFMHPGRFIGKEQWRESGWGVKKSSNILVLQAKMEGQTEVQQNEMVSTQQAEREARQTREKTIRENRVRVRREREMGREIRGEHQDPYVNDW